MFQGLADIIGVPLDQLTLFLSMLLSFPLAFINYKITNPTARLWFGFITGFSLQLNMYGYGIHHIITPTLFTYFFILFFGRKLPPIIVLIFTMAQLSYIHLTKEDITEGRWSIEISVIYMMSVCKFSSLAFSYDDGAYEDSQIKNNYHRSKKYTEKPSLLECFSYIFYHTSSIVGPSFEFSDFRKFINQTDEYANIKIGEAIKGGLPDLLKAVCFIYPLVFMTKPYDMDFMAKPEFAEYSFWQQFVYMNIATTVLKSKYYVGWKLSTSCTKMSGLGSNPVLVKDEKNEDKIVNDFDKIENSVFRIVELHPNPKEKLKYWNRTVHLWLKYNLCLRILASDFPLFKNNTLVANFITFVFTSFWHGFYPGYYIGFFMCFFLEQAGTALDNKGYFYYIEKNTILAIFINFFFISLINYCGATFTLLTTDYAWKFAVNTRYAFIIGIFGLYLISMILPRVYKKPADEKPKARYFLGKMLA